MITRKLLFFLISVPEIFAIGGVHAQGITNPTCVIEDPGAGRHFILDNGSGSIFVRYGVAEPIVFAAGVMGNLAMDMEIWGDTLFVIDQNSLKGISRLDGSIVFNKVIPSSFFLRGIAVDSNGLVYVSDHRFPGFADSTVLWQVNPRTNEIRSLIDSGFFMATGIMYEESTHSIWILEQGSKVIKVFDIASSDYVDGPELHGLSAAEGIDSDLEGNLYITDVGLQVLFKYPVNHQWPIVSKSILSAVGKVNVNRTSDTLLLASAGQEDYRIGMDKTNKPFFQRTYGVTFDSSLNSFLVTDVAYAGSVIVLEADGSKQFIKQGGLDSGFVYTPSAILSSGSSIFTGSLGSIKVIDRLDQSVRVINLPTVEPVIDLHWGPMGHLYVLVKTFDIHSINIYRIDTNDFTVVPFNDQGFRFASSFYYDTERDQFIVGTARLGPDSSCIWTLNGDGSNPSKVYCPTEGISDILGIVGNGAGEFYISTNQRSIWKLSTEFRKIDIIHGDFGIPVKLYMDRADNQLVITSSSDFISTYSLGPSNSRVLSRSTVGPRLYPNPGLPGERITVQSLKKVSKISLVSSEGREFEIITYQGYQEDEANPNLIKSYTLDLPGITSGVYLLKIWTNDQIWIEPLVIE